MLPSVRREADIRSRNGIRWQDPDVIFSAAVTLLSVDAYRQAVLGGLVLSIGSKLESTVSELPRQPQCIDGRPESPIGERIDHLFARQPIR